jgi:transcriptional regulator GlxA family with amidase domain
MYFFRYRADGDVFGNGKVTFRDTGRVASTLSLLRLSDEAVRPDEFACKKALFSDLVNQYRLENAVVEHTVTDPVVRSAMAYLDAGLHFKLDLTQLAKRHYLSYVQFSRRFKAATGSAPQDYISALRLKRAQSLLADSELPIKQIAQNCGFANEYYFSNFFHKHCQMSPTQYRNMIRSTDDT